MSPLSSLSKGELLRDSILAFPVAELELSRCSEGRRLEGFPCLFRKCFGSIIVLRCYKSNYCSNLQLQCVHMVLRGLCAGDIERPSPIDKSLSCHFPHTVSKTCRSHSLGAQSLTIWTWFPKVLNSFSCAINSSLHVLYFLKTTNRMLSHFWKEKNVELLEICH